MGKSRLSKPKTVVAAQLAEERKRKGLTQEQLAEAVYKSTGLIRKYEQGERIPPNAFLDDLAEYYGCTTAYLRGETHVRTVSEQKEIESQLVPIIKNYKAYVNARTSAISGSKFLMSLLGFSFETIQKADSHFLTVLLTEKDGKQFKMSEPDFVELLENFSAQSKDIMFNLLHYQQDEHLLKKAAPGDCQETAKHDP